MTFTLGLAEHPSSYDEHIDLDFSVETEVDQYNEITNHEYYSLETQQEYFGPVNRIVIGYKDIDGEQTKIEEIPALEHTHDYSTEFSYDVNSHWYECIYCEAKMGEESHSPDVDYCYGSICSDCGYNFGVTDPDAHIWDTNNYFCDDQNHWIECENCDARRDEAQHVASDTITCSGVLCTICNLPYGEGEGDHKPLGSYFYSDDQTHWKYCEYCLERIEQGEHEAGDVFCEGIRCTVCEDIYGEGDGVSHEFTYYNYYKSSYI